MSYFTSKLLAVEFHYIFFILTEHESSPSDGKKRTDKTQKSTHLAASFLCWKGIIISGLPNPVGSLPDSVSAFLVLHCAGLFHPQGSKCPAEGKASRPLQKTKNSLQAIHIL